MKNLFNRIFNIQKPITKEEFLNSIKIERDVNDNGSIISSTYLIPVGSNNKRNLKNITKWAKEIENNPFMLKSDFIK